jgi:hypothetical protein
MRVAPEPEKRLVAGFEPKLLMRFGLIGILIPALNLLVLDRWVFAGRRPDR